MSFLPHQRLENTTKAQSFMYDKQDDINSVIVGSSLSCMINDISGIYNLAFARQSSADGINMVLHENRKNIKTVFIENNLLPARSDKTFFNDLYSTIPYQLKKNIVSFRDGKQFISMVGHYWGIASNDVYNIFRDKLELMLKDEAPDRTPAIPTTSINIEEEDIDEIQDTIGYEAKPGIDMGLFNRMIEKRYNELSVPYTAEEIDKLKESFKETKELVEELEKKGIKVVFLEMPINNKLVNTARKNRHRELVKEVFSPSKYDYIELPPNYKTYFTTDGIHLTHKEAIRYTKYFKKKVEELSSE
ncbi:hypothetical protein D0T53_12720 [Dysgonomonas sp. 216]|nr:hypothetical protein [Dysgonomonas sp. 216]